MSKQLKIFLNYFLGPILFLVLSWSLYSQIRQQPDLANRWQQISNSWHQPACWLVLFLVVVNWGVEARKWQVLVQHVQRFSFVNAFKSVLSGCSVTMLTPNRIGEYGGRILYVEEGNRIKAISLTLVGSISQLLVTMVMGTCGLLYLRYFSHPGNNGNAVLPVFWGDVLIYMSITITIVLSLFYLRLGWLVRMMEKIPTLHKVVNHIRVLDEFNNIQLIRILSLSLGRYMVFVLQYILLLKAMDVQISMILCFWLIAVFYLLLAVAPSIGFIELPMRVSFCWVLLKDYTSNELGVGTAALGIWLVNLVVPAIVGSLFILSIKIMKEKNE